MQESWGTYSDRVSRLGWEGASERPMAWRAPWRHLDLVVVLAALSLALLGLAAIYSSTFASLHEQGLAEATFARRQLLSLGGGLAGMVLVALVDYRRYQAYAVVVFAAVVTPLGTATHGAQSWFGLGPLRLQPSEYAKVGMIVVLAATLDGRGERPGLRRLGLALGAMALVSVEILLQPDFGTLMVFVAVVFGMLLVGGVQLRWLLVLALIGGIGVVGMFKLDVLKEYQKQRL